MAEAKQILFLWFSLSLSLFFPFFFSTQMIEKPKFQQTQFLKTF